MQEGLREEEEQVREGQEGKESRPQREGKVMTAHFKQSLALALTLVLAALAFATASAQAAAGPEWKLTAVPTPTNLVPGGSRNGYLISATNVGAGSTDGSTITLSDVLPAGITATKVTSFDAYAEAEGVMSCTPAPTTEPTCAYAATVDPGDTLILALEVEVPGGLLGGIPGNVLDAAAVSGGGAAGVARSAPTTVSSTPAGFGVAPGSVVSALSSQQAGAHANYTTNFTLNTSSYDEPAGTVKNFRFDLPPGLVGNTVGLARCTMQNVTEIVVQPSGCPENAIVGMATVALGGARPEQATPKIFTTPVYAITPAPGEPVAFAFDAISFPVRLDTSILSDGNYAARVTVPDLTEAAADLFTSLTIWGVPADHNGPGPDQWIGREQGARPFGGHGIGEPRVPLLSNPQQCDEPLTVTMAVDPWEDPGAFQSLSSPVGTLSGCGLLPFTASASMLPDTLQAGAPAGYSLDLKVPQSTGPDALATPNVKRVVATLPLGTVISPSAADGLGVCSDAAFYGPTRGSQEPAAPGACPRDAQVGTVQIKTPALEEPLTGQVYLAEPQCGVCTPEDAQDGRMVRLFVQVVGEGESGIVVKLEGRGEIDQQTGRITTVFENNPQLPFSEFKLSLGGGERATLANPRTCGPASTTLDLTPWSTPFTPDFSPTSTFVPTGCYGAQFNPSFTAGTTSNAAGGFSPFTVAFGRSDVDQFLSGVQMRFPPGLLASVASVPQCAEPQAAQGICGAGSLIGHVTAETGPGADPYLVEGGQVFLTGPYNGAPYGLSIVVPAKAGPYTLAGTTGNGTVVVRAAIAVDPKTAALTVTSGVGGDSIPRTLDGIPLQLRLVNVTVDRSNFTFDPTNCNPHAIAATLSSGEGASSRAASSFQITNCAALAFKPGFTVATAGKTSKANGASLDAKVVYPKAAPGTQANIASVKVDLPKQLPSRLTTLQKACTAAVFNANPASCPASSVVGVVRASTPVLESMLTGPVYFVSHGGEAFPALEVILQGDGVRVDLTGATFISKAGITSSTFATVPDVPISSFELYLPEGRYSALAANLPAKAHGSFCGQTLTMPTAFVAQNGTVIHESTRIGITGCAKAKPKAKPRKKRAKAGEVRGAREAGARNGDRRAGR
jgi:hypothetical protein